MRLSRNDALTLLKESLATLPSELDARADFFIQWRVRTIQALELTFPEDPTIVAAFKNIDFSPRRLTKNETRDAQLKLDAFLSGCVAARAHLEELVRRVLSEPESLPAPPPTAATTEPAPAIAAVAVPEPLDVKPAARVEARPVYIRPEPTPPSLMPDDLSASTARLDAAPKSVPARAVVPPLPTTPSELEPTPHVRRPKAEPVIPVAQTYTPVAEPVTRLAEAVSPDPVIKGAHMRSQELCAPVRSSLSRVLGAWDRGDREAAVVLSAQLLADLTVLSHDDHFKTAFDGVVSKFVGRNGVGGALDSLQTAAPLCVWSMVAAINEVMKPNVAKHENVERRT